MHLCSAPNCQPSGCYKEHSEGRERNEKGKSKVSAPERLKAQAVTKGGRGTWFLCTEASSQGLRSRTPELKIQASASLTIQVEILEAFL